MNAIHECWKARQVASPTIHFPPVCEDMMQKVRELLTKAAEAERVGEIQWADALGAMAANKLAQVVRISGQVVPLN